MFEVERIRSKFPGLARGAVFFDNPAGTQIAQSAIDRMTQYLINTNANHGGTFATSIESDALVDDARLAAAEFLGANRPEEIVFGPNMTTLTLHISRSIATRLSAGDTIVVSRLDHDANITPWTLIAADKGLNVEWVDFDVETGKLRLETLEAALEKKPKLVSVGYASNALGTINPIKQITEMAHQAGSWVFVDAVQYAPHGTIDVQALDVEFLACSAYKFYGPHVGLLYGKYDLLDAMKAYKVRPASDLPPGKFETGTGNFEGIAGVLGALDYYAWVGREFGSPADDSRQSLLRAGMATARTYEESLSKALLIRLQAIPEVTIYGQDDAGDVSQRVPTVAINLKGKHPEQVAQSLAERGIYVWSGNYYALSVTERLGVEDSGGMVRIGAAQYNTLEEIERLGTALEKITRE
ncbi:MAG: cysteine desulfurase-like protein [Anaerolineales bacterium]